MASIVIIFAENWGLIDTLIKILGQYLLKNYSYTKLLRGSYNKSAMISGVGHGCFLSREHQSTSWFICKIKTCSWTYGIDSLKNWKLECKKKEKKPESTSKKKKVNWLTNPREWLGGL